MRWHSLICPFKPVRLFFYIFWPLTLFLYIIFCLYYNNKNNNAAQWWTPQRIRTQRLEVRGSIPASSNLHFHICFQEIWCAFKPTIHHAPSSSNMPDGQMARSGGQALKAHHKPVTAYALDNKKSTWVSTIGPAKLLSTVSNQAHFHSFSYILFIYFNYFILFN